MKKILVDTSLFEGKKVGVALSGGRDSMCLLSVLVDAGISPLAIHIEHGIRGNDSISDMNFVKDYASKHNIELKIYRIDAPKIAKEKGLSLEQAARIARYEVFDSLIKDGVVDCIALAHHANDQAETILMRILRGTGIKGLEGMQIQNGYYVRPLLEYTRDDINDYVIANNIPYVEDLTNAEDIYTRNFLRQEINKLKEKYPNIEESFLRLARNANDAEDFISKFVPEPIVDGDTATINIVDLKDRAIASRLIQKAMRCIGVMQDVEEKHIEAVLDLTTKENGSRRELSHSADAYKEEDKIVFTKRTEKIDVCIPFKDVLGGEILNYSVEKLNEIPDDNSIRIIHANFNNLSKTIYMDLDKIPADALVRNRQDGDYISKFGGGTKSLGDYLTDKKIPLRLRDKIIVCAKDNDVLCVFGIEISSKVAIDDKTKQVIKISYK